MGRFTSAAPRWPHLLEVGAATSSTSDPSAGLEGQAHSAGYCAAKHGLIGLTRALAVEFTADRLRVNAVCPDGMLTPQVTDFAAPENAHYTLILRIAAPRGMMNPVDVAKAIAFLASDDAAAIHGAVYAVDNGKTAG
jgi:meso-butanediol dehydrogenase / (S,S)-butanediol dehydrogenase / diacetyl reductase